MYLPFVINMSFHCSPPSCTVILKNSKEQGDVVDCIIDIEIADYIMQLVKEIENKKKT